MAAASSDSVAAPPPPEHPASNGRPGAGPDDAEDDLDPRICQFLRFLVEVAIRTLLEERKDIWRQTPGPEDANDLERRHERT